MKKYVLLIVSTIIVIGSLLYVKTYVYTPIFVESTSMQLTNEYEYINCNGRIETGSSQNIMPDFPFVAENIYVSQNEYVHKGERLASVDIEKTLSLISDRYGSDIVENSESLEAIAKLYGISNLSSLTTRTGQSYSNMTNYITAPSSGYITQINLNQSNLCSLNEPIFKLSKSRKLYVKLNVAESNLKDLSVGLNVLISGKGLNGDYNGKIKSISDCAKQVYNGLYTETVVETIVDMDSTGNDFKEGLSTNGKIITKKHDDILVVPYEAVLYAQDDSKYVYTIVDNRAVRTFITTGIQFEDGYEVTQGLSVGDEVICKSQFIEKLFDGMKIYRSEEFN